MNLVAASLDEIVSLFLSDAMADSYGEDLSVRDHSLQCADYALRQGLSLPLIAAALLHDIGWVIGDTHEISGARFVSQVLGDTVAAPIALHVAAKRYLVAKRSDYAAGLSAMSLRTLAMQGGPMGSAEMLAFERDPNSADAVSLRLLDDMSKDLEAPAPGLENYLPILEQIVAERR